MMERGKLFRVQTIDRRAFSFSLYKYVGRICIWIFKIRIVVGSFIIYLWVRRYCSYTHRGFFFKSGIILKISEKPLVKDEEIKEVYRI